MVSGFGKLDKSMALSFAMLENAFCQTVSDEVLMKYLVIALVSCQSLSITTAWAQDAAKTELVQHNAENVNRPEGQSSNQSSITSSFMPTDHVGPGALSFMVGKWRGSVDGETWEEVWSENKDKTVLMSLRSIQDKNGVVDFEVCVLRAGKHGGTPYFKKLSPLLMEETKDPWIGGIGQDTANSAFIELNLKDEEGTVQNKQVLSYTKKSENLTILKIKRNASERIIELHKVAL